MYWSNISLGESKTESNKTSKNSDGDNSALHRSNSLVQIKQKDFNLNYYVKKVFGEMLEEVRENFERRKVDYEFDLRIRRVKFYLKKI